MTSENNVNSNPSPDGGINGEFNGGQELVDSVNSDKDEMDMDREINDLEGGVEENGDVISQGELVNRLLQAWRNEQCSPVLLPHKEHLVSTMVSQLDNMADNFKECSDQVPPLALAIHKMEATRLGYIVNDYMRTRLRKIEEHPEALIKVYNERQQKGRPDLFSAAELEFANGFAESRVQIFRDVFFEIIPPAHAQVPVKPLVTADEGVILESISSKTCNLSFEDICDQGEKTINVSVVPGSINWLPYEAVQELIEDDLMLLL